MVATNRSTVRGSARATTDHDEIRRWVEAHGGHPATVKRTSKGNTPGILRVDFPGFSGKDSLEEISWDAFFDRFEKQNLAFLYQDQTGAGRPSRFNKLVSRDSVELEPPSGVTQRSSSRKKTGGTRAKASGAARGSRTTKARSTTARATKKTRSASTSRAASGTTRKTSSARSKRGTAKASTSSRATSARQTKRTPSTKRSTARNKAAA